MSEEPPHEETPYPNDVKAATQREYTALFGRAVAIRHKEWTCNEPPELHNRRGGPQELHDLALVPEHYAMPG